MNKNKLKGYSKEPSQWDGSLEHQKGVDGLFDLILYVHSTIFQLCGTVLPGFNQY